MGRLADRQRAESLGSSEWTNRTVFESEPACRPIIHTEKCPLTCEGNSAIPPSYGRLGNIGHKSQQFSVS